MAANMRADKISEIRTPDVSVIKQSLGMSLQVLATYRLE